jgi:hypothetical protein
MFKATFSILERIEVERLSNLESKKSGIKFYNFCIRQFFPFVTGGGGGMVTGSAKQ